jgi:hypothetical protein
MYPPGHIEPGCKTPKRQATLVFCGGEASNTCTGVWVLFARVIQLLAQTGGLENDILHTQG